MERVDEATSPDFVTAGAPMNTSEPGLLRRSSVTAQVFSGQDFEAASFSNLLPQKSRIRLSRRLYQELVRRSSSERDV